MNASCNSSPLTSAKFITLNLVAGVMATTITGLSADAARGLPSPQFAGVRAGRSEPPSVYHAEVYGDWRLPWAASVGRGFAISTFASGAAGWIGDSNHDTAIGSLGPSFRLTYDDLPVALVGGSSPTLIGRNRIGGRNLGSAFQFTSHIGVALNIGFATEIGYRLQHLSNAGLGNDNPGLNSQVVFVGWKF